MTQFQLLLSEPHKDVLVFGLAGEIDLGTVRPLKEAAETASANGYRALVFDLTRVKFMDSSGLHVLVEAHKAMEAQGRAIKVVCSAPPLLRVFELTGLDTVLTIVASRDQALSGYASTA